MAEETDISGAAKARTDQLNADDLRFIDGMIVKIVRVRYLGEGKEQPLHLHLQGFDGRPYKPCKTMIRMLLVGWGKNGQRYVGRYLRLYRDPDVSFGDQGKVGGIRISHCSDLGGPVIEKQTVQRGVKAPFRIDPLTPEMIAAAGFGEDSLALLRAACAAALKRGWTRDQISGVLGAPSAAAVPEADRPRIVAELASDPPNGSAASEEAGP